MKTGEPDKTQKAVIYCRVSSTKQVETGHGLESQETRCRLYADSKGYDVEAVFPDGVSGGGDFMKRPGMVALLSYLDAQKGQSYVVVFDDLKRFARDTEFHIKLRREFALRGARVECLNFKFEDTPEGEFIETILAAQGQLERKQNGRQVAQKMKARTMNGYWCFPAPIGYKYENRKEHGKVLVPDEPLASIIREAFEGYASGRFQTQAEVKRYFEGIAAFPKSANGYVVQQRVSDILTQPLYAGLVSYAPWDICVRRGKHEALISIETFDRAQERRAGVAKAPARKNLNKDFALRGFVCCADCGRPYTSCWSQGKYKKYPYYLCDTKGCVSYRKSINRAKLESAFDKIVQTMQPSPTLLGLATDFFKHAWNQRLAQSKYLLQSVKTELKGVEKQLDGMLERIVETDNPTLITAYEDKIEKLERQRLILREKAENPLPNKGTFEDSIELALWFLSNPWKIWDSGRYELRRILLRLAFADRMTYCRENGYRTPDLALPYKALNGLHDQKYKMVPPERLELPTY